MKILQYCQHVLGIGHFFRTLEICRALSDHEVVLVTGGARIDIALPGHVQEVSLPSLSMDREFKNFSTGEKGISVQAIKQKRRRALFKVYKETAPDIFMIELYPFGRNAFSFEIDPVLKGIRFDLLKPARVVCSLRDILVDKKKYTPSYEDRVVASLNRYFDALLVHADPSVLKLDETFSSGGAITIPVFYTGFVTPAPPPGAGERLRKQLGIKDSNPFVVASLGGGRVGESLLETVIKAFKLLKTSNSGVLQVFTGPLMNSKKFEQILAVADERIKVARFTPDFLSYLAAADLSVSMAGYNTCMNVLAAGVPALVWPFSQNREQRLRAERLASGGGLKVLSDKDIDPGRLADIMEKTLSQPGRSKAPVDLNGAKNTAKWIENWMKVEQAKGV
ncbi:MAG: glycosyltransferase [Thermodesulfobacteriota bacterium]